MSTTPQETPEKSLDLVLERVVPVRPELVWRAWTQAEHLYKWFVPAPWSLADCELDLKPGGIFRTVMRSPEGEEFPGTGCYLEVVENTRLVWTSALLPGFRPAVPQEGEFLFTAKIELEAVDGGTRYRATAIHADEDGAEKHRAMGYFEGWGKCLEQLVELASTWE